MHTHAYAFGLVPTPLLRSSACLRPRPCQLHPKGVPASPHTVLRGPSGCPAPCPRPRRSCPRAGSVPRGDVLCACRPGLAGPRPAGSLQLPAATSAPSRPRQHLVNRHTRRARLAHPGSSAAPPGQPRRLPHSQAAVRPVQLRPARAGLLPSVLHCMDPFQTLGRAVIRCASILATPCHAYLLKQ